MKNWEETLVYPEATIIEALGVIDRGAMRVALVVGRDRTLLGVVTDGDVRRGILRKCSLNDSVTAVMNTRPVTAELADSKEYLLALMQAHGLVHVPILDEAGRVVMLETLEALSRPGPRDNWVVLMAGGLGKRLAPLTEVCPKPLLRIGSKPILEIILESFIQAGFSRFFLSVNYMKDMIRKYFEDGSRWGVQIEYLEEESRLGTAGSLTLLPQVPEKPFFVMNGDLLTRINFSHVLDFHQKHEASATMCVRKVEEVIPYGVVDLEHHRLVRVVEKPVNSYFVNAGIYLLDPKVLSLIPKGRYFDMTDLFRQIFDARMTATAFPFLDYWLDVGRMGDFQQACQDYPKVFEP
ncbi:MAG: nucleotidyltransferase family protein [Magnetococcales bacterium]|nr:nucleotidyltransferase family protein [Magnetococcales bacterium]